MPTRAERRGQSADQNQKRLRRQERTWRGSHAARENRTRARKKHKDGRKRVDDVPRPRLQLSS